MKKTLFIITLIFFATLVVVLVILNDKKVIEPVVDTNVTTTSVKTVVELQPIPKGFREVILDSGLRFGIPKDWSATTTDNKNYFTKYYYIYNTDDYLDEIVIDRVGEGTEDDFIIKSGFSLKIRFSDSIVSQDVKDWHEDSINSRCKTSIENKCSKIGNSKDWSITKMNYNYSPQYIQYVYFAGKIINNRAIDFELYPAQDADPAETEKLFMEILGTVAVVEPK